MNKYGISINIYSSADQCVHMSVVRLSSIEPFVVFCQAYVHVGSTPCNRLLICCIISSITSAIAEQSECVQINRIVFPYSSFDHLYTWWEDWDFVILLRMLCTYATWTVDISCGQLAGPGIQLDDKPIKNASS